MTYTRTDAELAEEIRRTEAYCAHVSELLATRKQERCDLNKTIEQLEYSLTDSTQDLDNLHAAQTDREAQRGCPVGWGDERPVPGCSGPGCWQCAHLAGLVGETQ